MYDQLDNLYTDIKNPSSFGSKIKLFEAAKKIYPDIKLSDIESFLKTQDSYTLHGNVPRKFLRRQVIVRRPGILLSGDLCDMTHLKEYNKNIRYLAFFIDCYSRKLDIIPLEDKKGITLAKVIDNFLTKNKFNYKLFWTDSGSEYINLHTMKVYDSHKIKHYTTYDRLIKASFVERSIQTIKHKIYRILTHFNTNKYIDILSDIVNTYNITAHRGLCGLTPNEVHSMSDMKKLDALTIKMMDQKFRNYGGIYKRDFKKSLSLVKELAINTPVRLLIAETEDNFQKSFKQIYTTEIFLIDKIDRETVPVTYYLRDLKDQKIKGQVYRHQLKETVIPKHFPIEKVLRTRKVNGQTEYLVKFKGYSDDFNEWVKSLTPL